MVATKEKEGGRRRLRGWGRGVREGEDTRKMEVARGKRRAYWGADLGEEEEEEEEEESTPLFRATPL